jgi:rhomboid protease GluP
MVARSQYNARMATAGDDFLLKLLMACAERAPTPLYPAQYAKENGLDRDALDAALDELRRRGLIQLTDWVKDLGQGRALTDAGKNALTTSDLRAAPATSRHESPLDDAGSTFERGEIVRRAIFEPRTPYVSWTLLAINVLVFFFGAVFAWFDRMPWRPNDDPWSRTRDYLVGAGDETGRVLGDLRGLVRGDVLARQRRPQFERLVVFFFLHVGILHLALNMFFLATLSGLVESMWGPVRFLALYFIAGVVSGCVIVIIEILRPPDQILVTVGASAPLYGIFTALVVWFALNFQHLPEDAIQEYSRTIGINLILLVGMNFAGGMSWQGHFGGAVGGLLAALLLHVQRFHAARAVRILALVGLPMIPVAFFVAMLWQAGWI